MSDNNNKSRDWIFQFRKESIESFSADFKHFLHNKWIGQQRLRLTLHHPNDLPKETAKVLHDLLDVTDLQFRVCLFFFLRVTFFFLEFVVVLTALQKCLCATSHPL